MKANEGQVGGKHYKTQKIQHWDFVLESGLPYMEAQIVKYLSRWQQKGGREDIQKALHFLEKLVEWERTYPEAHKVLLLFSPQFENITVAEYCHINGIPYLEGRIIECVCTWRSEHYTWTAIEEIAIPLCQRLLDFTLTVLEGEAAEFVGGMPLMPLNPSPFPPTHKVGMP